MEALFIFSGWKKSIDVIAGFPKKAANHGQREQDRNHQTHSITFSRFIGIIQTKIQNQTLPYQGGKKKRHQQI